MHSVNRLNAFESEEMRMNNLQILVSSIVELEAIRKFNEFVEINVNSVYTVTEVNRLHQKRARESH